MANCSLCKNEKPHEELGICCPKCDGIRWQVHKTKTKAGHIQRIRICHGCGYRLLTHEKPANA